MCMLIYNVCNGREEHLKKATMPTKECAIISDYSCAIVSSVDTEKGHAGSEAVRF